MANTNLYFSERENGLSPQINEEINERTWRGLAAIIKRLISKEFFGGSFPSTNNCSYCKGTISTNEDLFKETLYSETGVENYDYQLEKLQTLDLIEFCHKYVAYPETIQSSCWGHEHYNFDVERGKNDFCKEINTLFNRNGIAYKLEENGKVIRLIPFAFQESMQLSFNTGNKELDDLLEGAKEKYLNPNPDLTLRREALEKLWDAWERLKSIEHSDKKKSIEILLKKAANEPKIIDILDHEADTQLTKAIGNGLYIRHTEVSQKHIESNEQFDYFFQRLFAMIHLLLKARNNPIS